MILTAIQIVFALLTLASIAFYVIGLIALSDFKKRSQPQSGATLPVSILKPLKGSDPEMYEAFRSHCLIDYPEFEILFGVNSLEDEAVPAVRRLMEEFPHRAIRLVVCEETVGANRKVSNLARMTREAKHGILVVNDSDITVPADYLRDLVRWFTDAKVGLVTCLYRGRAGKSVWSQLEALGIGADFIPGTLTSRLLEGGVRFGLGSTLAVRRESLAKIGGFESLADFLADDYELAARLSQAGFEVQVPSIVLETALPDYTFRDFWHHQLRWGRTVRSSRPGGYFGMSLTFGMVWAMLALASSAGAAWAWEMLGLVVAFRIITTLCYGRLLGDRKIASYLPLLPLRDLVSPLVWAFSLGGRTVVWRGEVFPLEKGKLGRP